MFDSTNPHYGETHGQVHETHRSGLHDPGDRYERARRRGCRAMESGGSWPRLRIAPELAGARVSMVDFGRNDVRAYVEALAAIEPDLIGFSIYVWSTPCMVEVARQIKRRLPGCTIVFGGPSARTVLFELAPYAEPHTYLDAVVPSDGEFTFREIAQLPELSRRRA